MRIIYRFGAMAVVVTGYTACIFFDEQMYAVSSTEASASSTGAAGSGGASSTGSTGGNGGSGGGGGSGGDGGAPPSCVPSENDSPVEDSCGVFVSSSLGDDSNAKLKGTPFKTLSKALSVAQGRPVYACAEEFDEAVVVSSEATIYGGLACKDAWKYVGNTAKTILTGPADTIPLTVQGETTTIKVEDFSVSATSAIKPGGSSIAVLVDQATATFHRCDLTAGDGADGLNGASPPVPEKQAPPGNPGSQACTGHPASVSVPGGDPMPNPMCSTSIGGKGGDGLSMDNGDAGEDGTGTPVAAANGGTAMDGLCTDGGPGTDGSDGAEGAGASAPGTLTPEGYIGAPGANGADGTVAQGGGGGGGKRNRDCNSVAMGVQFGPGASGGSGGPGGCGGVGGQGGKAGGASIALVSIQANVSLKDVSLTAANGGQGGDGGQGQTGQSGGNGGAAGEGLNNVAPGCKGGEGGKGGKGGKGGGGRGGHSIGIAYTGDAPIRGEVTITLPEMETSGGPGGTPGGEPGLRLETKSFWWGPVYSPDYTRQQVE